MILLDTNVISEMMRPEPDERVVLWLRTQPPELLATTAVTVAEIRFGLARLPLGRRSARQMDAFEAFLSRGFSDRVFAFDRQAADLYGELVAARQRQGRPLAGFDGLIAAIARARRCSIATRDVMGFTHCGLEVLNPWGVSG